jgi:S1-C subfamily serine protease
VVEIEGTACGLGLQGSGWVVRPGLVATNAHVIAGEHDTHVVVNGGDLPATPVFVSAREDIALLRVPGLKLPALRTASNDPSGTRVVLLGYPEGGPLTPFPGTAGRPSGVVAPDAYGRGPEMRTVVPLRGQLEHGDSGGPALDREGRVVAMMFAATAEPGKGGYGVPVEQVTQAAQEQQQSVGSGPCVA